VYPYLFKDRSGRPQPALSCDAQGNTRAADGVTFFDLDQAVSRFKLSREALIDEWVSVFSDAMQTPPDEARAGSVAPAAGVKIKPSAMHDIIHAVKFPHLSDDQFAYVRMECESRGIDLRLIWVKLDFNEETQRPEPVIITTIPVLRNLAEQTGRRKHESLPEYCAADGVFKPGPWTSDEPPIAARVLLEIEGCSKPVEGLATWKRCAQYKKTADHSVELADHWKIERGGAEQLGKCFDAETEVLTSEGFQRFADVTGKVLQVTERGLEPTDAVPFVQDYDGPMVTLDSDDLNFCVTPNHDMITTGGKMEAGTLYEDARAKPRHFIPRLVTGTKPDVPDISDEELMLAGAYLADGSDASSTNAFIIGVSRDWKIRSLEAIGLFSSRKLRVETGRSHSIGTQTFTHTKDRTVFYYRHERIQWLVNRVKNVNRDNLLKLSRRQARIFVDTLREFDGSKNRKTGVRRYYCSYPRIQTAFELAAVMAGYAVNQGSYRYGQVGKPNRCYTVSERCDIPVSRWGRTERFKNVKTEFHQGLKLVPNASGRVWCVTVPSGVIVVRRNGFSMLCGNCASADAHRRALPEKCGKLYTNDEISLAYRSDERKTATDLTRKTDLTRGQDVINIGTGEVVEAERPQMPTSAPTLVDDPQRAWKLVDESTPDSEQSLLRDLINADAGGAKECRALIGMFKTKLPLLAGKHFQAFAAVVLRAVRDHPAAYGIAQPV
jgi:hypothetical protein